MRVVDIVEGTVVDGPGLRTTIYFAGCPHRCDGCHNPSTWDPMAGKEMSIDEILEIIDEADFNVTFSGGEPLMQIDGGLLELAGLIKRRGKTIWCYTGYTIEEIEESPSLKRILEWIDYVVDGRFMKSLRDVTLQFRGSSNQRIIKINHK